MYKPLQNVPVITLFENAEPRYYVVENSCNPSGPIFILYSVMTPVMKR